MKPGMTSLNPKAIDTQNTVRELQEKIINQTKQTLGEENITESFVNSLSKAIQNVSEAQLKSAELTKNFELGIQNYRFNGFYINIFYNFSVCRCMYLSN